MLSGAHSATLKSNALFARPDVSMKNLALLICLLVLPYLAAENSHNDVELLGEKASIRFDEVKAIYIANTVRALL